MAGEVRGRFLWHELLTTDTRAAQPFYKTVVGWGVEAWDQDKTYQMWMTKTGPVGGIMTLPEDARAMGAPPNWLTYVGTPDVDATVRQATQRGARVLKEAFSIPKVGRMAVLADPQGAVFAAYTPDGWSGPSPVPGMGEFSWHELATTDPVAAFTFYHALFGWDKTDSFDMGPELGLYQMYGLAGSGQTMGGIYRKPAEMPAPPNWLPYALVPNADRAADRAKAAGGTILNGPMEVPGGDRIAMLLDPQGAAFAVHSRATAAPVAKK
ncbi:MAG TPA: VOC family protein, partial [Gemmatimonadales bacterium]|nr:VOC family protein [Gemmatimonadales bacterium]